MHHAYFVENISATGYRLFLERRVESEVRHGESVPPEAGGSEMGNRNAKRRQELFAEDFLYVADFALNLSAGFFRGPTILQVAIAGRFPGLLFDLAFNFVRRAFDFVFRARFHTGDSCAVRWEDGRK